MENNTEYEVEQFVYNGFFVKARTIKGLPAKAPYKAKFIAWTSDPGIARCACTDGKERLIPSCQLVGFKEEDHPYQKKTGVIFGQPSKS